MNGFLNGESFPKPGLMKRICDHFSVNARILLEPLAELEAEKRHQNPGDVRGMSGPCDYAFFGRDYSVTEENVNREIVPDGLHLMIHPSFMWRDGYWIGMVRFFNKGGAQVMRGFDPIARGMRRSDLTPMKVREYRGLLLNSSESISFLYATRIPNTVIGIDHFGASPKCGASIMNILVRLGFDQPNTLVKERSTASVISSMSSVVAINAGLKHSVLLYPGIDRFVAPINTPCAAQSATTAWTSFSSAGSFVARSATNSAPQNRPLPRT